MEYILSDIIELIGGGTPKTSIPEYWDGDIPWLSVKDFSGEKRYVYETEKSITEEGLNNSSTKYLNQDDIIVSARGTVGEMAMIPFPMTFNQSCYGIRAKRHLVDPFYLYYLMKYNLGVLKSKVHGSVFDTITKDTFKQITVDLQCLEVQKKVAAILGNLDDKIEINEKINRNLTEQFRAIVDDFVENLEDYRLMRLDEVAECQNGHAFYKDGYDESGAFVIDLGNVNTSANFVYTNGDKYISIDRYEQSKLEKYHVFKDDLVMVMTDRKSTMDLLGKTGKIYKDGYYLLNQRMYRIRAKDNINVNYLYAILNSSKVCNSLKEKALGSVQKYVNTKEINEIEIMLPTPEKMEELAQVVNPISSKMETNILENENLHNLRDELLPKLMSGELDISDLNI